jgi:hypothetical protein
MLLSGGQNALQQLSSFSNERPQKTGFYCCEQGSKSTQRKPPYLKNNSSPVFPWEEEKKSWNEEKNKINQSNK